LVGLPLTTPRNSSTDDANSAPPVRMGNYEEPPRLGLAEEEKAILLVRMVWVMDGVRQGVAKGATRLLEGDTVAAEVLGGLLGVPLEREAHAK